MTAAMNDAPATADELLTAYADDPTSLPAAERAAVEARLAADPAAARELAELRAVLADVRAHGDVADAGTDWAALEAGIRAAATPPSRRRWAIGAGVVLAAAAAVALWWQRRDDGPRFDLARLVPALPAPSAPVPPAPAPDIIDDGSLDELDDELALELGGDDLGSDEMLDHEVLIGRAVERVPAAEDDGLFPGLDTEWIDDLSEVEVQQALRWLEQQGAG